MSYDTSEMSDEFEEVFDEIGQEADRGVLTKTGSCGITGTELPFLDFDFSCKKFDADRAVTWDDLIGAFESLNFDMDVRTAQRNFDNLYHLSFCDVRGLLNYLLKFPVSSPPKERCQFDSTKACATVQAWQRTIEYLTIMFQVFHLLELLEESGGLMYTEFLNCDMELYDNHADLYDDHMEPDDGHDNIRSQIQTLSMTDDQHHDTPSVVRNRMDMQHAPTASQHTWAQLARVAIGFLQSADFQYRCALYRWVERCMPCQLPTLDIFMRIHECTEEAAMHIMKRRVAHEYSRQFTTHQDLCANRPSRDCDPSCNLWPIQELLPPSFSPYEECVRLGLLAARFRILFQRT